MMKLPKGAITLVAVVLAACSPQGAGPAPSRSAVIASSPAVQPTPAAEGPLWLSVIQRLNQRVGYIAGRRGSGVGLAKTVDNGSTWQLIAVPADELTALRFIDEQTGWVAGYASNRGVVLRTTDGGLTWATVLKLENWIGGADPIGALQAVDGQRAWVLTLKAASCQAGCAYDLQRTTDGGKTWTIVLSGQIGAIRFASATRGWVSLGDAQGPAVRETSDGGLSWTMALRPTGGGVIALDAATIDTAWALTRDGAYCTASNCMRYGLFRTDDGGRTWANLGNPKDYTWNCSGGHLDGPLFASTTRGWFGIDLGAGGVNVGPGGMLTSNDGGRTWRCRTTPPNVTTVSAADPLHVWAASYNRIDQSTTLYTTEDGGVTWQALNLGGLR